MTSINKKIGILTVGGDCPGLNAAIRAIVRRGKQLGFEVLGIEDGWEGLIGKIRVRALKGEDVRGILNIGGTILGSSNIKPPQIKKRKAKIIKNLEKLQIEGLIVIGGDTTLKLTKDILKNFPIVFIPKTIDNDVEGTDFCLGFWSAVQTATNALDNLRTTAKSHHRAMVLEVMGRNFGWIATYAGLAGGADFILIPEAKIDFERLCRTVERRVTKGKRFSLIVVSEEAILKRGKDFKIKKSNQEIGEKVAELLSKKTGIDTRSVRLGHVLRGGVPCAFDRILGNRFGVAAVECVSKKQFEKAIVLKGDRVLSLPFSKIKGKKKVNLEVYKTASIFFH